MINIITKKGNGLISHINCPVKNAYKLVRQFSGQKNKYITKI